jgi:hypothetical protein
VTRRAYVFFRASINVVSPRAYSPCVQIFTQKGVRLFGHATRILFAVRSAVCTGRLWRLVDQTSRAVPHYAMPADSMNDGRSTRLMPSGARFACNARLN